LSYTRLGTGHAIGNPPSSTELARRAKRLTDRDSLPYHASNGTPERHRCNLDRPLLVALVDSCGAMARLIG